MTDAVNIYSPSGALSGNKACMCIFLPLPPSITANASDDILPFFMLTVTGPFPSDIPKGYALTVKAEILVAAVTAASTAGKPFLMFMLNILQKININFLQLNDNTTYCQMSITDKK